MDEVGCEYKVGRGKPPLHSRFKKGKSGNPRGPRAKNLPALLAAALNEPVVVTANGQSQRITKREAVVAQLVDKSTGADLRATKMLIDMLKDIEKQAGVTPAPEPLPVHRGRRGDRREPHRSIAARGIGENSPRRHGGVSPSPPFRGQGGEGGASRA
jgi:Family of unknown function (DUF5681)